MENNNNKGSIWRIWDLHVHSPATYTGDYNEFIRNVSASKADVIGINDYCTLSGYREIQNLGGIPNKIIFPVVEFRMHNIVANRKNADPTKAGTKVNFHVIFDNDPELLDSIQTWLNSLECYNERGVTIQLGTATDLMKVTFDFEKVISSLKNISLYDDHSLIWLPYDEYGGIDEIDPSDNFFKLALINKAQIIGSSTLKQIQFFKWEDSRFTIKQYEQWFEKPKPCIKGSDAHEIDYAFGCLRDSVSRPTDRYCWINADTTFKGLKQIIVEPERVFIGDEPNLLKRIRTNQTKFIKSLAIKKVDGITVDDVWFDNFKIELNGGLVAIIGNKGGGKSAITDIIGLCGNSHQDMSNYSFLNPNKFRKQKPYDLSERFEATLTWQDGKEARKSLNENPDMNLPERVKYIPQNFLEHLCADLESEGFENELKQIIFSHTPIDKRLNKSSLDELIKYKSDVITDEISKIQAQITKLNLEIVLLESKSTNDYKISIENKLQLKKDELAAHEGILPQKPNVSSELSDASNTLVSNLNALREEINQLEKEIMELRGRKNELSIRAEELNKAFQFYSSLDVQLKKRFDEKDEFAQILKKNEIKLDEVFVYEIKTRIIQAKLEPMQQEMKEINLALDITLENSKTYKLQKLNQQLQSGQEELDKPAKDQQRYQDVLKKWEQQRQTILGSISIEGSLKYFEELLKYLSNQLPTELTLKIADRSKILSELFEKKLQLIEIRKELFQPVTQFINDFTELKERAYDVKLDVVLELRSFPDGFFGFVNQGRIGTFSGKEEGYKKLLELIEKTDFGTSEGVMGFTSELVDSLNSDKRVTGNTSIDINTQLRKNVQLNQLYDFLFQLEYLQPVYNLKLGNKTLQELSPGERGALLLIFYLILDNDDIPLIIDQPEENLDNESVYHILVHFIKMVKEKRQIIIVTHNPNLAIVCDADQVIHMDIEKEKKNTVKLSTGAIEDSLMNKAALNILEGTLPAFINRDSKYIRQRIK